MVSRARSSITRLALAVAIVALLTNGIVLPAQAQNPSICLDAYGTSLQSIPDWLDPNLLDFDLSTHNRYDLLTGHLLQTGWVNGSTCPSGGMNADGSANGCGLEIARETSIAWQNRYDPAIRDTAARQQISARVLKAVIAVESQFWPGADWVKGEIGLGQITENGADLTLTYQTDFYQKICRQVFGEEGCNIAYGFRNPGDQSLLRGQVLRNIDAACPNCMGGVDLEKGNRQIDVLAEALNASCRQSARMIELATGKRPSAVLSYEDFWRFSLGNYHTGSGCSLAAMRNTSEPDSWSAINANFPPGCSGSAEYVRRVEEQIKP